MKKRGMLDQIFLYVLALFLTALILFYGYKAILSLQQRAEELTLIRFEKNLKAKIETISSQYGSIRIEEFSVPGGVTSVCFADKSNLQEDRAGLCSPSSQNYQPVVCNALKERTDTVFLLPILQNLYVDKILVPTGTFCTPVQGRLISLRLTGKGDGTLVEAGHG